MAVILTEPEMSKPEKEAAMASITEEHLNMDEAQEIATMAARPLPLPHPLSRPLPCQIASSGAEFTKEMAEELGTIVDPAKFEELKEAEKAAEAVSSLRRETLGEGEKGKELQMDHDIVPGLTEVNETSEVLTRLLALQDTIPIPPGPQQRRHPPHRPQDAPLPQEGEQGQAPQGSLPSPRPSPPPIQARPVPRSWRPPPPPTSSRASSTLTATARSASRVPHICSDGGGAMMG